jgi:hypothetical protein
MLESSVLVEQWNIITFKSAIPQSRLLMTVVEGHVGDMYRLCNPRRVKVKVVSYSSHPFDMSALRSGPR